LNSDYHSALILWGWKNSLSSSKIISLFDKNVFKKLGYFDCWDSSVKELKNRFAKTNIDFTYFWRSVKRYPSFMHSLNHPKVFVISELSKLISLELGMSEHILKEPIHDLLTDKLDAQRWPVYPEIAKNFGITGFYRWKIRKDFYNSLHEFIEMSVESYKQSDFSADEVSFFTEGYQRFNQLLSELK
jgi:hypothetical protein